MLTQRACHVNMKTAIYEPRREAWNGDFSTAVRRNQLYQHIDFRVRVQRIVRQRTSVVSATQFVALGYGSPRKLILSLEH